MMQLTQYDLALAAIGGLLVAIVVAQLVETSLILPLAAVALLLVGYSLFFAGVGQQ